MEKETIKTNLWLDWAREIQSLSQTGLAFASTGYEKQRYTRLTEIAAEIIENYTNLTKENIVKSLLNQPGYATPKIDVRAAVINEGKILLVHEKSDNLWAMPGGWADVGDTPSEVVIRETKEESGFDVLPEKVIGVFDANRSGRPLEFFHAFKIVFICKLIGGTAQPSDETYGADFFNLDHLPPLSPNRTNQKHLMEIKAHLADIKRPAYFD